MAKIAIGVNIQNGKTIIDGSKKILPLLKEILNGLIDTGKFTKKGVNSVFGNLLVTSFDLEDDIEYDQIIKEIDNEVYMIVKIEGDIEILVDAIINTLDDLNEMFEETYGKKLENISINKEDYLKKNKD